MVPHGEREMTTARSHRRKILRAKERAASGKPLRRWELERLERDRKEREEAVEGPKSVDYDHEIDGEEEP